MSIKLEAFTAADWVPVFRDRLATYAPTHAQLDYAAMFATGRRRAAQIWNREIVADLDIERQRAFERELMSVGMRAGLAIPYIFANGFVYGLSCALRAGADQDERHEAGVTCGLYFFILGLFDHLFDEHPEQFAGVGDLFSPEAIRRWALDREVDALQCEGTPLAQGLVNLYRVYFERCHRVLDRHPDAALAELWCATLCEMHAGETRSAERRISKIEPGLAILEQTRELTESGFKALALTASLSQGHAAAQSVAEFGRAYGRLSWFVDDVTDLDKDRAADIWNGLAVRVMLEAKTQAGIAKVVKAAADEAGDILAQVYADQNEVWMPGDTFSLADYLWGGLWGWLDGLKVGATANAQSTAAGMH